MRLSSFLFGGVVGAAAAIYWTQKNNPLAKASFSFTGESVGNMMNKAKNTFTQTWNESSGGGSKMTGTGSGGMNKVEQLVNEDPNLKSEVSGILAESGTKTSESSSMTV